MRNYVFPPPQRCTSFHSATKAVPMEALAHGVAAASHNAPSLSPLQQCISLWLSRPSAATGTLASSGGECCGGLHSHHCNRERVSIACPPSSRVLPAFQCVPTIMAGRSSSSKRAAAPCVPVQSMLQAGPAALGSIDVATLACVVAHPCPSNSTYHLPISP